MMLLHTFSVKVNLRRGPKQISYQLFSLSIRIPYTEYRVIMRNCLQLVRSRV
jgi:hypothetical protein